MSEKSALRQLPDCCGHAGFKSLSFFRFFRVLSLTGLFLLATAAIADAKNKPFPKAPDHTGQNLQVCPEYGPGFFKTPGSDTCIRIGGRIRGETGIRSGGGRRGGAIDWRTEGSVDMDTRDASPDSRLMIRLRGMRSSN